MVQAYIISVFSSSWYKYNRFCLPKSVLDESLVAFLCFNSMFFFSIKFYQNWNVVFMFFLQCSIESNFCLVLANLVRAYLFKIEN